MQRKSVGSKVSEAKGASQYFAPDEGTQPQEEKQPEPQPKTEPTPIPETETHTVMGTDMGTELGTMLKPSDDYIRKVYYPLVQHDKFIKANAKRYKRTESEIVRIMFDFFIKNGKI